MEGYFIEKKTEFTKKDADRYLLGFRRMRGIARSSATFKRSIGADGALDDATLQAEMFGVRSAILSVEDVSERYLLYNYYVKGHTVEVCARMLGISLRSAHRLKARALESVARRMSEDKA